MAIKLIAFDWNGTLLADTAPCCEASNLLLKYYGKKPMTVLRYRQTFRIPVLDYYVSNGFKKKFLLSHAKEMSQKFIAYYEPLVTHCRSRSGSKEILKWLSKNHIISILFSNHTMAGIESQVNRLGISRYLKEILAHDKDHHKNMDKRGKEEKLINFIRDNGYKKTEVLVIGDTDEEIEIGKRHGFHTVGITGGHQVANLIKKHSPDFLIHNMIELKKIVKQLNKV